MKDLPELAMHFGLQPRDIDDLTPTELGTFLGYLEAMRRSDG